MTIKKYQAKTEKEAIILAKEDLGSDAIVMNVKTTKPNGIFKLFKKTKVEVTAAIDDEKEAYVDKTVSVPKFNDAFAEKSNSKYEDGANNAIEEKINSIAKLLEQQMSVKPEIDIDKHVLAMNTESIKIDETNQDKVDSDISNKTSHQRVIELIKNQLMDNEVLSVYAEMIMKELDIENDKLPLDNILSSVYQKLVLKLGEISPLQLSENKPKLVYFVGNTGVGKTTTMAKLASRCKLKNKNKIALLSVDTYRIAAIEQIKTYANILNIPIDVVYTPEDMQKCIGKYNDCDYIFIDTAGRSHKNPEQKNDLETIINSVKDYEREIYLVMSITTKYSDLKNIANAYGEMFDYKLIFTKLDETKGIGNILNLKLDMDKRLSYVTWGQNVPDDIGELNPQIIAKKLLGGNE